VESISAGNLFTCALLANKTVRCWGENGFGQLGNDSTLDTVTPVEPAVTNVNSLSAGDMHVCVTTSMTIPLSRNGYCWGSNGYGQLGDGTTTNRLVPTQVNFAFSSARVYYVYSGDFHTCMHSSAAGTFSTASCWGFNASGQLGDGTTINRTSPVDTGWTAPRLAIGSMHTCLATGSPLNILRCWGQNNQGQLGDGTNTSRSTLVDVLP
jgi:alpha-tubulin suppressor-like RCC1 family protein